MTDGTPTFAAPLHAGQFAELCGGSRLGSRMHFFQRTESTNDLALTAGKAGAPHGSVFVAETQDAGRGRRGRSWECAPGAGLLFSVLVRPLPMPGQFAGWIPLLAGYACARACAELSCACDAVAIKWPNDLVVRADAAPGWKKLGGILCESVLSAGADSGGDSFVVIGIGLNVNQTREMLPPKVKAEALSLRMLTGAIVERATLLILVLKHLDQVLREFENEDTRARLRAAIGERLGDFFGERRVSFSGPTCGEDVRGFFKGVDEFGRLLILRGSEVRAYADIEITLLD